MDCHADVRVGCHTDVRVDCHADVHVGCHMDVAASSCRPSRSRLPTLNDTTIRSHPPSPTKQKYANAAAIFRRRRGARRRVHRRDSIGRDSVRRLPSSSS